MSFGCVLVSAIQSSLDLSREEAIEMAGKIIAAGAQNGDSETRYYWPQRLTELDPAARDAAIRQQFNGRNLIEICDKHGVSHMTVYRAVRASNLG